MVNKKIIPLTFSNYLAFIKNSISSKSYRNLYIKIDNRKIDATQNGLLSCAFFVSSILVIFGFIKRIHATVASTIRDLEESGWKEIKKPKIGSVLVWEEMDFGNNEFHKHIGFFIGKNQAISNSYKLKCPVKHHYTFQGKRKIISIFWNPKFKRLK